MRLSNRKSLAPAFTLIELLVVIAIISLLIGLLLAAIQRIRTKVPELDTKNEIAQIGVSIENYKTTMDVKYLPSVFILAYNYNANTDPALADSRRYYAKVWPKAFLAPGVAPDMVPGTGYTRTPPNTAVTLDGNQALMFFLGGISPPTQSTFNPQGFPASWQGNYSGFLNSPTNPFNRNAAGNLSTGVATGSGVSTKGPFFDFKLARIDGDGHYHDPHWRGDRNDTTNRLYWGENVYYYFSSKEGNDYNYFGIYNNLIPTIGAGGGYGGMVPFLGPDGKYLNPSTYQLVSAGANWLPGPGGPNYVAGTGAYQPTMPGFDDQSNFAARLLGAAD